MTWPKVAATFVAVIALTLFIACGEGGDGTPAVAPSGKPIDIPAGAIAAGGGPPEFQQPVPIVPGDYKPPSASRTALEKEAAALEIAKGMPQFNGVINGFRLYGLEDAARDPSLRQQECVADRFPQVGLLLFTYLPPGTSAISPQYAGVCVDGTTAWVTQDFVYNYGRFSVSYELGERAIGTDATAERVSEATVAGRPGVIIRPIIEEGNGQSIVAFVMDKGFILVGAVNLPLSETLKIAEGVKCASC